MDVSAKLSVMEKVMELVKEFDLENSGDIKRVYLFINILESLNILDELNRNDLDTLLELLNIDV